MNIEFNDLNVEREYKRWQAELANGPLYTNDDAVGTQLVLAAHFLLVDAFFSTREGIGGVGPRSIDLLESAVGRQHTGFGGKNKWTTEFEKCATLLFGLVRNHPFHDANKRTGLLVALSYLQHNKYLICIEQKWLDRFIVAIAEHKIADFFRDIPYSFKKSLLRLRIENDDDEVYAIASFLHKATRREKHDEPLLTFNGLNSVLKRYGFELMNPQGNFIDLIKHEPAKKVFLFTTPPRSVKIGQVGFPSWKTKVSRNAMKTIRTETGLTRANGFDSEALFNGAEPIAGLIHEYIGPLKRLAYK